MSQTPLNQKDQKKNNKKLNPFFTLIGRRDTPLSIYEEEQVQSPFRTIIKSFSENKVGMIALGCFIIILLTVTIGPLIHPIDLGHADSTQVNIAPGLSLMRVPSELDGNIRQISIGPAFSIGLSNDGQVYAWGNTRITRTINMDQIPSNMGNVVQIAAGHDHAVALNSQGQLFGWGSNRMQQLNFPHEVTSGNRIKSIHAGFQITVIITNDGYTYLVGNDRAYDFSPMHSYQGQIKDVAISAEHIVGLTFDNEVVHLGRRQTAFSNIPTNMGKVVGIASTASTLAAINDRGEVFVWGNPSGVRGEARVPEFEGRAVSIAGGRHHYVAKTDRGEIIAWGSNFNGQTDISRRVKGATNITSIFVGSNQNYAITEDGRAKTWGLRGYLMGTDELGRCTFTRLLHGGRMTMTVGAVAVVIQTIIGVSLGGISAYFGGKTDVFIQRISEIVSSIPFLPIAMILSSFIGNALTQAQRVYLIMVILGVLTWPGLYRLVRGQVFTVREQEYVTAAKIVGINEFRIIFRHILPNVMTVIVISMTFGFSGSMLTESALSFLGFGILPPTPTWGNMLNGARNSVVIQNFWWRWVFPSIALSMCVICINMIGEAFRDAIDPKSRER